MSFKLHGAYAPKDPAEATQLGMKIIVIDILRPFSRLAGLGARRSYSGVPRCAEERVIGQRARAARVKPYLQRWGGASPVLAFCWSLHKVQSFGTLPNIPAAKKLLASRLHVLGESTECTRWVKFLATHLHFVRHFY